MKKDSRKTQRRYKQGCAVIDNSLKLDSRVELLGLIYLIEKVRVKPKG